MVRTWRLAPFAAGIVLAAVGIAACGGNTQSVPVPLSVAGLAALTPDRAKQPPPANGLLYVSDWSTGDVFAYLWPSGNSVASATITSFAGSEPDGLCVDRHGRVIVTDYLVGTVRSYPRGSPSVHRTFNLPAGITSAQAIGCSVDQLNHLAVAYYSTSLGHAAIAVWPHEANGPGAPNVYSDTSCDAMWSPGYDHDGNLFVEGMSGGVVSICELPDGATTMNTVALNGATISSPGGVMWDGHYIMLSDQDASGANLTALYQTTLSGTVLTVQGATTLSDTCYSNYTDLPQPFVVGTHNTPMTMTQGHSVIGANLSCPLGGLGEVGFWAYPAGGSSTGHLASVPANPQGQAVSFPP